MTHPTEPTHAASYIPYLDSRHTPHTIVTCLLSTKHAHTLHGPCTLHEKHISHAYSIYETHNTNKPAVQTFHILRTGIQDSLYLSCSIIVSMKLAHRKHQGHTLDIPHVKHIPSTQHTWGTQHTEHRHTTYTCVHTTCTLDARCTTHTHTSLVEPSCFVRVTWEQQAEAGK